MKRVYSIGKVDYNGSGRKNCLATLEYELKPDGRFSMCGNIWNPRKTDIYCGGQCVDEIAKYFPNNKTVQRMAAVWKRWHLNDMQAGSPAQRAFLETRPELRDYSERKAALAAACLDPDASYLHNGKPYEYGSAWLKDELPPEIIEEIQNWPHDGQEIQPPDDFAAWLEKTFDFSAAYQGEREGMDSYRCIFTPKGRKGESKAFEFKQGFGHRRDYNGKPYSAKREFRSMNGRFSPIRSAPDAKQVFDCLLSDARAYDENRDVADFMESFGYDDLRRARRVWQACEKTYCDLAELIGGGTLARLLSDDDFIPA